MKLASLEGEIWMITDRKGVPDLLTACLNASPFVSAIVLREKDWSFEETADFCNALNEGWDKMSKFQVTPLGFVKPALILNWNGSFDPSSLPIQGLHLGFDLAFSLSKGLQDGRPLLDASPLKIGASIHNQKEWEAVNSLPLDYVILSNIFETPCKPHKQGLGLDGTAAILKTIRADNPAIRAYGLGGLKIQDKAVFTALGLQGIALRSAFF